MIGQTVSHYRILELLGVGGMGEVYRAEDINLGRSVALKFLPIEVAKDAERIHRFEKEAKAASALNHPNILTIHEIVQCDDLHFIVSEFIDGENLHERLEREPLSLDETLEIAVQVADALVVAHKAGIVHRDIKPKNIMLRKDGLVKIVDFGIAKLIDKKVPTIGCEDPTIIITRTSPGAFMGTAAYMSPEQLQEKEIDARSDVWSLGICLYEMLAGHSPFLQGTLCATAAAVLRDELEPLDENVPAELRRIVWKALQKRPEERYQTIKDFWLDLKALKHDLEFAKQIKPPKIVHPEPPARRRGRGISQYKYGFAVGLAILLMMAIVAVPWYRQNKAIRHVEIGREYWKQRTGDNLNKAKEHFEQAIAYDPNYAQAYSDLADTYVLMEEYLGAPTQETIPKAEYYARQALAMNDSLAETHTSLAFILTKLWRWDEAEKEFKRAIELNSKYPKTRQWYGLFFRIVGRYDESLTQFKIGRDLDPSDKLIRVNMVISYIAKEENNNAIREGVELLNLAPNFWGGRCWLGMAYLGRGPESKGDALTDLEAGVNHSQDSHSLIGNLGYAYAISGETDKAIEQIERLKELYKHQKATGQSVAKVYAGLGRKDEAFEWLEKDYEVRSGDLPHISWHPAFKNLHGDPRYDDLLRRMGLQPRIDNTKQMMKPLASTNQLSGK